RVEDSIRLVELPQTQYALRVADIGDLGMELQPRVGDLELAVEKIEAVLIDVHEHEALRLEASDLPRDLPADRAGRARHEQPLAGHEAAHFLGIEGPLVSRQQVLGTQIVQHRRGNPIVQVREGNWNDLELKLQSGTEAQNRL